MNLNNDFNSELRKHFTGDILLDLGSRILYSTDASIYQIEPLGVVIPRTVDDLQAAVELAAKYTIPILPRGSGTSLAGQAIGEALILDCSRFLDKIIEIDPESRSATVQPGVILSTLNRAVAQYGLQFGPDPASAERATMGGVIANNATGAHSILYGMTADHLLSAEVIQADGSLATWGEIAINNSRPELITNYSSVAQKAIEIRVNYAEAIKAHYPLSWRNSAGYRLNYLLPWSPSKPPRWINDAYPPENPERINLAALLAGSEGTLGLISRAKLNLVSKPRHTILGIISYKSVADACDAVPGLLEYGPSAIELIPELILRLARTIPAYARQMMWVPSSESGVGEPQALLVIEFSGEDPETLKKAVNSLSRNIVVIEPIEEQARVWNIRKMGLGLLDSRPQPARPAAFIEDCAIPVEHLGDFVREIERILREHNIEGGIYAHASAGCLHIRPIIDLRNSKGVRYLREIAEQTLALTLRLGGSMSSEHGDGIVRGEWLKQTYGDVLTNAMLSLKRAADPQGILNPGKMFEAPRMDTHLRYGADYQVRAWPPGIAIAEDQRLITAIEQCNGQGVCRKKTGVMCPSFQATRDEKYSTRGRANLLRALIRVSSGGRIRDSVGSNYGGYHSRGTSNPASALNEKNELSKDVFDALDLCLACKGCKAECPSGVDMAKLKIVFQDEYYRHHPRLFRDFLFGYFHVTAALLSSISPLTNLFTGFDVIKNLSARLTKITERRPFPKFSFKSAKVKRLLGYRKVLFLRDPFTHFVEPEIEQAAFDLLHELKYDVELLPIIGAGASLLSKGFLPSARKHAKKLVAELIKHDSENSIPVVGIEPSELYALKHDYVDLLPEMKTEIALRIPRIWLLEEFLVRSDTFIKLRVANNNKKILLHPHCHQRAENPADDGISNGANASLELLHHTGYKVDLIDAGCCGMAGTFGYESEHYELSQQIGALQLFPIIKNLRNKEIVAATGAACRMQIKQGTGISVMHPIGLALLAIRNESNPNTGG